MIRGEIVIGTQIARAFELQKLLQGVVYGREHLEKLRIAKAILGALAEDRELGLRVVDGYWRCRYCGRGSYVGNIPSEQWDEGWWYQCHHAGCRVWDIHMFLRT